MYRGLVCFPVLFDLFRQLAICLAVLNVHTIPFLRSAIYSKQIPRNQFIDTSLTLLRHYFKITDELIMVIIAS